MHRGMAPDAKLAFMDLANSQSGGIITPQDLASRYYPYAYAVRDPLCYQDVPSPHLGFCAPGWSKRACLLCIVR